jgi:hypothetical protein
MRWTKPEAAGACCPYGYLFNLPGETIGEKAKAAGISRRTAARYKAQGCAKSMGLAPQGTHSCSLDKAVEGLFAGAGLLRASSDSEPES